MSNTNSFNQNATDKPEDKKAGPAAAPEAAKGTDKSPPAAYPIMTFHA